MHPQPRLEYKSWAETWHANKETITTLIQNGKATPDIAFLGASIVEEMDGKWFGNSLDTGLSNLGQLFAKNFHTSEGAALEGVALGIAGDTVSIVLNLVIINSSKSACPLSDLTSYNDKHQHPNRVLLFFGGCSMEKCQLPSIRRYGG